MRQALNPVVGEVIKVIALSSGCNSAVCALV